MAKKSVALADAVKVTGRVTWAPPLAPGMACRVVRFGWYVNATITEVIDAQAGEVLVLADPDQPATATQDGETWELFTPGEPFQVSWEQGLEAVRRVDGRWERPVLEVVRETPRAVPGWQLSDAVRCDPAYRNRVTGGGIQGGPGGKFVGRGEGGKPVERRRWTTTLRPQALDILRALAERDGISRNDVVERLLLGDGPGDEGRPAVVVSTRVSEALAERIKAAAAAAGQTESAWLRHQLARVVP